MNTILTVVIFSSIYREGKQEKYLTDLYLFIILSHPSIFHPALSNSDCVPWSEYFSGSAHTCPGLPGGQHLKHVLQPGQPAQHQAMGQEYHCY